jgi:PAS domain S-box-containing protein
MDYRKIILPPVYGSLERSQKAAFLHYTLIIGAAALIIFGFLNLTWGAITLGALLLGISGFCIVGIILNKTNRYNLAAILYSALIFIAIFYNLIDGAALHDPGIAALPIFLILISILFHRSTIPYFTLATILGVIALYFFWKTGFLVLSKPPTLNRVLILSILQIITGLFSWMIVSTQGEIMGELDLSENRFQSLFMAAPIGIGVTSIDGRVLIYNESLIKMGGWTPDEFKLLNVQDYYANPEDRIEVMNILEAAGIVRGYETRFSRKDKGIFYVNMSIVPIKYGDEDALLTILEDISERKQADLEKQKELEFRRLLVDASPIFFTVVNRQGQTTMMNKSMLGALGYEWEEIREVDYIKTFVPEREQSAVLKVIEEEFEHIKTPVSENHILTKTGQEILVEWHASPIKNSKDQIELIFAYGVDITERKKAEIAVKESADRHRVFFEESPSLNWHFIIQPPMPLDLPIEEQIDCLLHNSSLLEVNESFALSQRENIGSLVGLNLYDSWGGKDDLGRGVLRDYINQGYKLRNYETPENTIRGEIDWSLINASSIIEDNHLNRFWGSTLDFTDRKHAEEELRESEEKFSKIFMESPYSMTIARQEDGVFSDINEYFENNFGYSREELIGRSALEYLTA